MKVAAALRIVFVVSVLAIIGCFGMIIVDQQAQLTALRGAMIKQFELDEIFIDYMENHECQQAPPVGRVRPREEVNS